MMVGGLEELPEVGTLIKKLHDMEMSAIEIDGIKVIWDFYKSNHFIDVFRVIPVAKLAQNLSPYAFIIHGSADEFKGDNESGFGIYYDRSKQLREKLGETILLTAFYKILLERFKFSCTVFRYGMHEHISYRIKTAGCQRS